MLSRFVPIVLIISTIVFLFLSQPSPRHEVVIQTDSSVYHFLVEIAMTAKEQAKGLMGRLDLPEGEGMLFVYPTGSQPGFWMKNMKIPLDIFFIGDDLLIKHIEHNIQPCEPDSICQSIKPPIPIKYVLEVRGGTAKTHNIDIGHRLILDELD